MNKGFKKYRKLAMDLAGHIRARLGAAWIAFITLSRARSSLQGIFSLRSFRWRRLVGFARPALLLLLLFGVERPLPIQGQAIITTVAGRGRTLVNSSGPATDLAFSAISGLALDPDGNVFVSDESYHVVFKISPDGIYTRYAGNGTAGFSGDGGPAVEASLDMPSALATDAAGNLYIADTNNVRIRRVSPSGVITTVAGGATLLYPNILTEGAPATAAAFNTVAGLAIGSAGELYVNAYVYIYSMPIGGRVKVFAGNGDFSSFSGDGGAAIEASFNSPAGLAADSGGNLYFADSGNQRVRKVDRHGIVTTVAGNGEYGAEGDGGLATAAQLGGPVAVALDSKDLLYICDYAIRRVTPDGKIQRVAGGGGLHGDGIPATEVSLNYPIAVAVDSAENIYIAERGNLRIRKVSSDTGIISTIAGNGSSVFSGDGGPALEADLDFPTGVALDSAGNLLIADHENNRIRKVSAGTGVITTVAGNGEAGYSGDGGPAVEAMLYKPLSVITDRSDNLYFSGLDHRIRKVESATGLITTIAGNGSSYFSGDGGPAVTAVLAGPRGLALHQDGSLFIADHAAIRMVDLESGLIMRVAGNGILGFSGDGGPATDAMLDSPYDVALDAAGNLFIADTQNFRIRKVDRSGIITTIAGHGGVDMREGIAATEIGFDYPEVIALDGQGNLFIMAGYSIYRVNPQGFASFIVNANTNLDTFWLPSFSGDDGPGRLARIGNWSRDRASQGEMVVDSSGNLYRADTGNHRIRKIAGVASPTMLVADDRWVWLRNQELPPATNEIRNLGSGDLYWEATTKTSAGGPWLSVAPAAGKAPSTLAITANSEGLAPGGYRGTVVVSSRGTSNSPWEIPVFLNVDGSMAQVAVGGGISSTLALHNAGETLAYTDLEIRDQEGKPLPVRYVEIGSADAGEEKRQNASGVASNLRLLFHPGVTRILSLSSPDAHDSPKVGWVSLWSSNATSAVASPNGFVTFSLSTGGTLQSVAGVMATPGAKAYTIPVDNDVSKQRFTGFAVANPADREDVIRVRLLLLNEDGSTADSVTPPELNPLLPRQQVARFLHECLPARSTFRGSLALVEESGQRFLVTALTQNQGKLSTLPALPTVAPQAAGGSSGSSEAVASTLLFPQVAVGGGLSTTFALVNTNGFPVTGTLTLKASNGTPMTVSLTALTGESGPPGGPTESSSLTLTLPAGGTRFVLAGAAVPEAPVKVGWAHFETTGGKVGGVATFTLLGQDRVKTTVGVLASEPVSEATIIVDDDESRDQRTGLAIVNPGSSPLTVKLIALNLDGTVAGELTPIRLEPGTQRALFFMEDPKASSTFHGSVVLIGEGGAKFSAVALSLYRGAAGPIYSAVPVIRGKAFGIN